MPTSTNQSSSLQSKLGAAIAQLRYLPRVGSLLWQTSRGWTVSWCALLVIQGLLPVATVILTRYVVDGVVEAVGAGATWEVVRILLVPVGAMGGVFLASELFGGLAGWIREHQSQLLQDHIAGLIHRKSVDVDLEFYETPGYYDQLHRARNEAWYRPHRLIETSGNLLRSCITLVAMGTVLLQFSGWIPLILVLSTIPALYVVVRNAVRQHRWRMRTTEDDRRAWYYDSEMTSSRAAAEIRLFNLGDYFIGKYQDIRLSLRRDRMKLLRQQAFGELGAAAIALVAMAATVAWMGWRMLNGQLTLGELALFYAAFRQGQQMMRGLLQNLGDIYRNILFLGNLFAFLDLKSTMTDSSDAVDAPAALVGGVDFCDVGFAYPGSDRKVLEGFNLNIPAGKVVAIVGPNGSGKSTLMRLLCRLYDPQSGHVAFDNQNIADFRLSEFRRLVTVLFQQPVQYSQTAGQNIAFGDLDSNASRSELVSAAGAAGADEIIAKLPDTYETLLGKWFDGGAELSVGEWQRIALARAFVRRSSIVLLDEPTSAMDSWAETEWMERLRVLVDGRTTVIITHRFTTAMRADVIYVMREGKIVESGNHQELLTQGGAYAQSWEAQMSQLS
jgi:ATP-binding cassette, subfamily B, bacterial